MLGAEGLTSSPGVASGASGLHAGGMTETELADMLRHCPVLYHMAEAGSWPSIQRHGLLSTRALLDLFAVHGPARDAALRTHRPAGVPLCHKVHGTAVLRDQKPMSDAALRRCLTGGMQPADWYELLNGRVFFWLSRQRLHKLLAGRAYRDADHNVLEVDAAALVAAYRAEIMLSPINSGATFALGPTARGPDTFQPIDAFDFATRRKHHPAPAYVVELMVGYAVPDIARFVRRVVSMRGDRELATLFAV